MNFLMKLIHYLLWSVAVVTYLRGEHIARADAGETNFNCLENYHQLTAFQQYIVANYKKIMSAISKRFAYSKFNFVSQRYAFPAIVYTTGNVTRFTM